MAHFDIKWEEGELSLCEASFSRPFITAALLSLLEAKLAVQRCVTDHLPRLSSTLFMPLFFARSQGDTDSESLGRSV